jgi:uncharacterized membrane-anchored protein YitT (DUF2179 family)
MVHGGPYNLTLCRLKSRLQHMYHIGQPYAIFDLNPMSESNLSPSQGLRIWPPDSLLYLYIPELVRMPYIAVNNIPCDVWTLIYVIAFHIYSLIWLPLPQLLDLFRLSFVRFSFLFKGTTPLEYTFLFPNVFAHKDRENFKSANIFPFMCGVFPTIIFSENCSQGGVSLWCCYIMVDFLMSIHKTVLALSSAFLDQSRSIFVLQLYSDKRQFRRYFVNYFLWRSTQYEA